MYAALARSTNWTSSHWRGDALMIWIENPTLKASTAKTGVLLLLHVWDISRRQRYA
jgi:hypothetical protein